MKLLLLFLSTLAIGFPAYASGSKHVHDSNYSGQEKQALKSLSADDIAELKRGGGWGMAKAAELNGVPGPAHLLDMKNKIPLDEEQISAITKVFKRMKGQAIQQGETLISLERELERHFQNRTVNDAILRSLLTAISAARNELRYIHLSTHLKTPKILSEEQIEKYNKLRGYSQSDPCANIPEEHKAAIDHKQNGCKW